MEPAREITVLIAEDHPVFRFGLRTVLAADATTRLVGEAETGEAAVAMAIELRPDVILMDLNLPGLHGVEATRRIAAACPEVNVLVLTMVETTDSVLAAMEAGARGYLLKGAGADDILRAIRAVSSGEAIFGANVAERLLQHMARAGDRARKRPQPFPELTAREYEVLALLAGGLTNQAIADQLYLSQKTVRNHISIIFSKLQVTDRGQAIILARDAGLGS
jgi:DNA-binding NarL/FixJ family response regulator